MTVTACMLLCFIISSKGQYAALSPVFSKADLETNGNGKQRHCCGASETAWDTGPEHGQAQTEKNVQLTQDLCP